MTDARGDHPVNPDIDLVSGEFWGRNPHPELTWLREHAPVYFDGRVWGIAAHADVREVSLHPELFRSGQGMRPDSGPLPMMIDTDGAEHTRRRQLVNRGFTPRRVADSADRIREICHRLIDQVIARGECDAVTDLAAWLPMHVIADMLGFPEAHRATLLEWSDGMLRGLVDTDDEDELMPAATEEMLRWVSPIKNMARTVAANTELRGQRLRAGDKVLLLYPSANRDENVFEDPFKFKITRTPNDHLSFGIGTHFCLGSNLARLELRCFFETLLERLPDIELATDVSTGDVLPGEGEPAYRPANFISGYEHLPVRFRPRTTAHF